MTKKESGIFKGMAIILMLIHHLFTEESVYADMNIQFFLLNKFHWQYLGALGKICVAIFVFVSAYGMTCNLDNNKEADCKALISRRLIKIIMSFGVIYILAFILSFCTGNIFSYYGKECFHFIYYSLIDMFGLAYAMGTPTLNATWWYMSFALFLPIIAYFVYTINEKIGGVATIVCAVLLPAFLEMVEPNAFKWYILTIVFGVLTSKYNLVERIKKCYCNFFSSFITIFIALFLIAGINQIRIGCGGYWLVDALLTILFLFIAIWISRIPIINTVLEFIGKHSMNIYLIHSFIFYYYFRKFTYMWKYPVIILTVLLLDSLLVSVIIEVIKKILKYDIFEKKCILNFVKTDETQE